MALLDNRNSPIDEDTPLSPAQIMYGRRLKTKLPTAIPLLKPAHSEEIRKSLKQRQYKQKHYYDKPALKSDLKPLEKGENVVMRHDNKWKHGTIERKHELPRSYVVKTPDGRKYRRNRKHLCPTKSVPIRTEPEEIVVQLPDIQPKTTSNGHANMNNKQRDHQKSWRNHRKKRDLDVFQKLLIATVVLRVVKRNMLNASIINSAYIQLCGYIVKIIQLFFIWITEVLIHISL